MTKTAAKSYCEEIRRKGELIPIKKSIGNFSTHTQDFWDYEKCSYVKSKKVRGQQIGTAYCNNMRALLKNHILPVFGTLPIVQITAQKIDKWLIGLPDKQISNETANKAFKCLKIILQEAYKQGLIHENPCEKVAQLAKNAKERGILEQSEAAQLLCEKTWNEVWQNKKLCYIGNLLAAITGMRNGEIRGLQADSLKYDDDHQPFLLVNQSVEKSGKLKGTKTGKTRYILIPSELEKRLIELIRFRKDGFLFTPDKGKSPIPEKHLSDALYQALAQVGIDESQRKARNLTFHSWRHFTNTTYRALGVADIKVQAITGHSTQAMTEHYSHFRISDFPEIKEVQSQMWRALA